MKIQLKMFTLAVLCIFLLYLWLPIHDSKTAYADNEGNGSTIAGNNVEGLDRKEIENVLIQAIEEWKSKGIKIIGGGLEISIDPTMINFDINASIDQYEALGQKPWYAFWESDRVVHLPLQVTVSEEVKNEIAENAIWKTDETYNQLVSQASFLLDSEIEAEILDQSIYETERNALSILEIPSNAYAPDELVHVLDDVIINPGKKFSFLETVSDATLQVNNESLNFVASLLYDAVLQTEFDILERHNQTKAPDYIELGKDASVNVALNQDLQFINNTDAVAKINLSVDGDLLKLEITSNIPGKEVLVKVDKDVLLPRIIYRYSSDMPVGQESILEEGKQGYRVMVYRTISTNGQTEEQKISRDYYAPTNRVVLKSSKQPEQTTNVESNVVDTNKTDKMLEIDLDGDGLPDTEIQVPSEDSDNPPIYDKGGNLVTP